MGELGVVSNAETNKKRCHKKVAIESFEAQRDAMERMIGNLDSGFEEAVELIMSTSGRVVVSGMGKSGIIGRKIAATLASTGTQSFFVHPAEAYHGDLGMIAPDDVVILLSYSGETDEVVKLIPSLHNFGNKIICIVGDMNSTLARNSDVALNASVEREICPNNLAPTTSTVAALAMGDALAVALIDARGFTPNDFARFHPGGSLGRRLLTKVKDVMHKKVPTSSPEDTGTELVYTMTKGRMGLSVVMEENKLVGIVTDGDLRRAMQTKGQIHQLSVKDIMSDSPITVPQDMMFADAEKLMQKEKITAVIVVDRDECPIGILHIYDM